MNAHTFAKTDFLCLSRRNAVSAVRTEQMHGESDGIKLWHVTASHCAILALMANSLWLLCAHSRVVFDSTLHDITTPHLRPMHDITTPHLLPMHDITTPHFCPMHDITTLQSYA